MSTEPAIRLHVKLESLDKKQADKSIWEHPVAKGLGAFFLTTLLGGTLGACWQSQHWAEQQAFALRNEQAKTRLALTSNVVRRVSEVFSATNGVRYLTILTGEGARPGSADDALRASLKVSVQEWLVKYREWEVEEKVLIAETRANFSDPEVSTLLGEIVANEKRLFELITQFIETSQGQPVPPVGDKRRTALLGINPEINTVVTSTVGPKGLLPRLSEKMIEETRAGQQAPRPWWSL